MRFWLKLVGVVLGVVVIGLVAFIVWIQQIQLKDIDPEHPPPFIEANFMDINDIYIISKYRSGVGHSAQGNGEVCRSMRHIFGGQNDPSAAFTDMDDKWNKIHTRPTPENSLNIYAPVTGRIIDLTRVDYKEYSDKRPNGIGGTIVIMSDKFPGFYARIDSVFPDLNLKPLSHVTAGQKIGIICKQCPGEIVVGYHYIGGERLVSYFAAMNDSVFAEYQKRGMKSRDEAIITKAYRDAHPFTCADPKNETSEIVDNPEMHDFKFSHVVLSGYIYPEENK